MKNTYKTASILILLLLNNWIGTAQIELKTEANLKAMVSAKEKSPFWMHTNQRGRLTDSTNIVSWVSMKGTYDLSEKSTIEIGGGLLYQDANNKVRLNIDELYGQFRNSWLQIIGGRKQHVELYDGLSATNGNILWSLNARPIPGIQVSTLEPIYFLLDKKLGFSSSWNEFHMYKNRYVENTLLHNKSLFLHYRNNEDLKIKLGIQHFVQWGGTSPDPKINKQPSGVIDYFRVVFGQEGSPDSVENINALGNHMGSYELRINKEYNTLDLEFLYSHYFEDGSGMMMYNLLDGRYGVHAKFKERSRYVEKKDWVESMMYEFYYTKDQSHNLTPWIHLWDNYFNNGIYKSGWTYNGQVIGIPFFTTNLYEGDATTIIGNNRVIVHHIGLNGFAFNRFPYKLLMSYRNNNGHVRNRGHYDYEFYRENDPRGKTRIAHEIISSYLDIRMLESFINLNLEVGVDASGDDVNVGVGLKLNKQF
jgi:hypothetical protein